MEAGLDPDMLLTLHDYAKDSGLPLPSGKRYAQEQVGKACMGPSAAGKQSGDGQYDRPRHASRAAVHHGPAG